MITFTASTDMTYLKGVVGFHVAETAGAAATVRLRNGSATGAIYVDIRLPAVTGGNSVHFSTPHAIRFPDGVYVEVAAGTVVGSIQPG